MGQYYVHFPNIILIKTMGKQYNSFKEIDERLMVLKLQRKIEIESLKLNINRKGKSKTTAIGRKP